MLKINTEEAKNIDKALQKYRKRFEKAKILMQLKGRKLHGEKHIEKRSLNPKGLSLVFNTSNCDVEEITDVINFLASIYHDLSGDNLEIKGISSLSMAPDPQEVQV